MKAYLHRSVRVHLWVVWWMVIGVICGIVAVTNILEHNLTRTQERILIAMGILNWMLGGLICYAFSGIQIEELSGPVTRKEETKAAKEAEQEWHSASDFLLPGSRKNLLPPRYR